MPVKKQAISKAKKSILPAFETPENLQVHLKEFESNMPDDEETLWNNATQFLNAEILSFIHAGQCFKKLRDHCDHGKFRAELASRGLKPNYVQERIQIAEKFMSLDISNASTCGHLGISKLRKVVAWEDDQVINFFKGEEVYGITIEQAQEMSKRDFEAQIKANKDETKAIKQELIEKEAALEDAEEEISVLKRQLNGENYLGEWPELVSVIRIESAALTTQAIAHVDEMQRLYDELIDDQDFNDVEMNAAVTSLYHNLAALQAKSGTLLSQITKDYGQDFDLAKAEHIVQLSNTELKLVLNNRQSLVREADQERLQREQQREAKKAPRRGRPRKIGGKP